MKPFWATFYSYKGGVGRSLALANTAALLVKKGRRVLLIDFDLEAPGLDSFSELSSSSGKPGVVEYVSEFIRKKSAPDIKAFIHRCELPRPLRGELWVMPAGRKDAAYNRQLSHINWAELYDSGLGAPFFANWKATVNSEYAPDLVFVDSRTGLTEIGGVCTTQFPDLVVMLFGLNEQNLRGTATVAQSIREANPDRVPQIHFVASPIPNYIPEERIPPSDKRALQRRGQLNDRLDAAATVLGSKVSSQIRYYPPAALCEKLFVLETQSPRPSIIIDYNDLCDHLIQSNRAGLDFLIDQSNEAIEAGDLQRMERISAVLDREYINRAEAIFLASRFAVARNDQDTAIALAERALLIDPMYEEPCTFLEKQYERLGQFEKLDDLYTRLVGFRDRLPEDRIFGLQFHRGTVLMALGNYALAEQCFREHNEYEEKSSVPDQMRLAGVFNFAEAARRASGKADRNEWQKILELFNQVGGTSDLTLSIQANRHQAMHIAYAICGKMEAAMESLIKARRAAQEIGEIEDVFSVKVYRQVSVDEFLKTNDEMIGALKNNRLWDGMSLT